ncbi:MAG: glycosyltransferase [Anaerolineae bacterium]|nr:glycosyltransferase [Anaerolineae bacterium]
MAANTSPLKTVILSPEMVGPIKNGGIGTYTTYFARLLRQNGYDVTIVFAGEMETPKQQWRSIYDEMGVPVIHAYAPFDDHQSFGNWWYIQRARLAAQLIPADTDVVYLQDWHANGFHLVRSRRYQPKPYPVCVNVLHSSTHWLADGMQQLPDEALTFLSLDYTERYVARHSDYVVASSEYILDWVRRQGWRLPSVERVRALGYPFFPNQLQTSTVTTHAPHFKRLVFFGRLETRKGLELFIDTLAYLKHDLKSTTLDTLEEVIFMGKEGEHSYLTAEGAARYLQETVGIPVTILNQLDTFSAQLYLAEHASDTLVVMPSLSEVFGFTVVECSLIPDLNSLFSNAGGIPEVLKEGGEHQLFSPHVRPFARKLEEWLTHGPRPDSERGHYDWQGANQTWLDFHAEVCEYAQHVKATPPRVIDMQPAKKLMDVCIPYYNHGRYLPQLLEALEHQTTQNFNVYVINDASTDEESVRVFETMKERYQSRGWHFATNAVNEGLSQTRNLAVAMGDAEYVLFVDADNVPAPNMVQRFFECIRYSGDDCLTSYMHAFEGHKPPYKIGEQVDTVSYPHKAAYTYLPVGDSLELSMFENGFGDANFIVRRDVFNALGGFILEEEHYRYIIGEDYEFLAKLVFEGYRMDVIPEFLFFYRHLATSLQRVTSRYQNTMRVQKVYRKQLDKVQLGQLSPLVYGLHLRAMELPYATNYTNPQWIATRIPWYILRDAFKHKLMKHVRRLTRRGTPSSAKPPGADPNA